MSEKITGMTEFTEICLEDKTMTKKQLFYELNELLVDYGDDTLFCRINLQGRVGVDIPVGENQ
jgi:hypothetical protein